MGKIVALSGAGRHAQLLLLYLGHARGRGTRVGSARRLGTSLSSDVYLPQAALGHPPPAGRVASPELYTHLPGSTNLLLTTT